MIVPLPVIGLPLLVILPLVPFTVTLVTLPVGAHAGTPATIVNT